MRKSMAVFLALAGLTMAGPAPACTASEWARTFRAYLLADELRQTSDSLTQMARLYAATGEERYKAYFQVILDIRNGVAPRPANPSQAYWDVALGLGKSPSAGAAGEPLQALLKAAGLSSDQLALAALAQERSDSLAVIERHAFQQPLEEAWETLHGEEYLRHKAEIMRPINALVQSLLTQCTLAP